MTFATLHVVGSNNNPPTAETPQIGNEDEWRARNDANIDWLKATFESAQRDDSKAMMPVMQANSSRKTPASLPASLEFKDALRRETVAFGKPVVLVHGDSHYFRVDKRLYADEANQEGHILNFTRVETFGDADVHWVRATVDTRDPEVFTFQPEIVEENIP